MKPFSLVALSDARCLEDGFECKYLFIEFRRESLKSFNVFLTDRNLHSLLFCYEMLFAAKRGSRDF